MPEHDREQRLHARRTVAEAAARESFTGLLVFFGAAYAILRERAVWYVVTGEPPSVVATGEDRRTTLPTCELPDFRQGLRAVD